MDSAGVRTVPGAILGAVDAIWAEAVRGRQRVRVRRTGLRVMGSPGEEVWVEGRKDERNVRDV
jgi:hypothetical protein